MKEVRDLLLCCLSLYGARLNFVCDMSMQDGLQQASSGHANRSSVSSDEEDDQDVLRTVPLPGWSIFDALFISWHDHPEAETSGAAFTDTPIARIQKFRRRFMITVTALLLLSAFTRAWPYFTSSHETRPSTSIPKVPSNSRLSSLFGWRSTSSSSIASHTAPLAGYPLSAAYYAALYNASSPPARLQPSQGRMAMLKAIAKARSSSYDPADFIVNHYDIVQHASTGGDPLDLFAKKASLGVGSPVLRPLAVSAVIVHSPDYDISSTQLIVNMAAKYPFIREIIIWNNDIGLYVNDNVSLS